MKKVFSEKSHFDFFLLLFWKRSFREQSFFCESCLMAKEVLAKKLFLLFFWAKQFIFWFKSNTMSVIYMKIHRIGTGFDANIAHFLYINFVLIFVCKMCAQYGAEFGATFAWKTSARVGLCFDAKTRKYWTSLSFMFNNSIQLVYMGVSPLI